MSMDSSVRVAIRVKRLCMLAAMHLGMDWYLSGYKFILGPFELALFVRPGVRSVTHANLMITPFAMWRRS